MERKERKRNPRHKCGVCGELCLQSDMVKDIGSDTGWICCDCFYIIHPEYDIDEW